MEDAVSWNLVGFRVGAICSEINEGGLRGAGEVAETESIAGDVFLNVADLGQGFF